MLQEFFDFTFHVPNCIVFIIRAVSNDALFIDNDKCGGGVPELRTYLICIKNIAFFIKDKRICDASAFHVVPEPFDGTQIFDGND